MLDRDRIPPGTLLEADWKTMSSDDWLEVWETDAGHDIMSPGKNAVVARLSAGEVLVVAPWKSNDIWIRVFCKNGEGFVSRNYVRVIWKTHESSEAFKHWRLDE